VPARNSTNLQGRLQGAVPAHHILLWICNETWNDLALPILRGLELLGDRGRRPHVPSSKPTMSKSRRISLPVGPGHRLAVERGANGVGQRPCPVGEAPYMEAGADRQWLFSENVTPGGDPFPNQGRTRRRGRNRPLDRDREAALRIQGRLRNIFKENSDLSEVTRRCEGRIWRPSRGPSSPFPALSIRP
jgi:hypothetical protein